jgi:hypothetical protein
MKTILIVLIAVLLSGCTIYKVKTERDAQGLVIVTAKIYSTRSFTAPNLAYERGEKTASFQFSADDVNQPGPQDYAAGVATGIQAMMVPVPPQ